MPNMQVGTIVGNDCVTGELIQISPGRMTQDMRKHYWHNPHELVGQIAKYKSFEYGSKDTSRFKTFQSLRDPSDMAS